MKVKCLLPGLMMVVVVSLYYFPTSLRAFTAVNSKMVLAAIGLVLFVWEHLKQRQPVIRRELFVVLVLAALFSLWSLFSVVYNGTDDMVYATYLVSAGVWLGGAYTVVTLLRRMYGRATLRHVFLYLGLVGAAQCVLAVLIDNLPALQDWVDTTFPIPVEYYEENDRLYGIGFGFDTGGIRLSCILLATGYLVRHEEDAVRRALFLCMFAVMGIVGNFVSRTTVVGVVLGGLYMMHSPPAWLRARLTRRHFLWGVGVSAAFCVLAGVIYYAYHHVASLRGSMEYGFEGFINFFRTGEFSTHSSDLLFSYWFEIWPDNLKTWLIGDGYFADPTGKEMFYAGTDAGYSVFVFYCGLVGLALFATYFAYCSHAVYRREGAHRLFFLAVLAVQLIVWVKIPTDIFCFYTLLLLADSSRPRSTVVTYAETVRPA